jgi:hypothetical protein
MTNKHLDAQQHTKQEAALIEAHAQRAAELRIQLDLLLLRSMTREAEQQQA